MGRTLGWLGCAAAAVLLWGCLGGSDDCEGREGCQCYPNATCDTPFTCASNLCVAVQNDPIAPGGGDVAAPGGDGDSGGGTQNGGGDTQNGGGSGNGGGDTQSGGGLPPVFSQSMPTDAAESIDCTSGTSMMVTGSLHTDVANVEFDSVEVEVLHKRDIDTEEDGCLRELRFHLAHGDGCALDVVARDEIDLQGRMKIVSATFSADSQCPMFPDEREGSYGGVTRFAFGGVAMEFDNVADYNVEQTCIRNTFWLQPIGEMTDAANRKLAITAGTDLTISGTFQSTAADGSCPVRQEPPPPPPTGGTGGMGGGGGTGGSSGGTGGSTGGTPIGGCPAPHVCVESSLLAPYLGPVTVCSLGADAFPITCTSIQECVTAGFSNNVSCLGQAIFALPDNYCFEFCTP